MLDRTKHLAAGLFDKAGHIALKAVAEGIIRSQKEPGVTALLHDRFRRSVRQGVGIVVEVECCRRACGVGEIRCGRT